MAASSAIHTDLVPRIIADRIISGGKPQNVYQRAVTATPFFTLLHFEGSGLPASPRVLVVEPLSGMRPLMMYDMLTDLVASCDVYTLVWTDPDDIAAAEGPFGLEDNIDALVYALQCLGPGTHLIGLCQSAMPAFAATAILSSGGTAIRPASLTLLGGKLDTRINPTRLDRIASSLSLEWFVRNAITRVPNFHPGAGRLVYSAELQSAVLLTYIARHILVGGEVFRKIMHDDGADAAAHPFLRLLSSLMAVPAEFFLDNLIVSFHDSYLAEGRLRWRGLPVDPSAITDTPLLTIEAEEDDISAPGQTYVAHKLCTALPQGLRAHHIESGIGHFGLFHGHKWHNIIRPRLLDFLRAHDAASASRKSNL